MLRTALCRRLGIELPIVCAPMGPDLSGPELVGAVSEAGGLGIMQAQFHPPALLREAIQRIRSITAKPFGLGFILVFPHDEGVAVCLEERVPVLQFFWGDPESQTIERAHKVGVTVFHQIGSVEEAQRCVRAGVDVIVAQGLEAGGHVRGQVGTMPLIPRVVDAVAPTPVVAAGGIADARGLVAALALGAEAVALGTRFLASVEANAHPVYKQKLVAATEEDTVHTILFGHGWPNAPHRTLRTPFVEAWRGKEERAQESRPDEPVIGETQIAGMPMPILRFMTIPPNAHATGDIDSMGLLAGQSVGLVADVRPAATIVRELAEGARALITERLDTLARGA